MLGRSCSYDNVRNPFGKFNRYWLRYGPNSALVFLLLAHFFPKIKDFVLKDPLSAALVLLLSLGLQYVFTLPILIAHVFRLPSDGNRRYAMRREKIKIVHAQLEKSNFTDFQNSFSAPLGLGTPSSPASKNPWLKLATEKEALESFSIARRTLSQLRGDGLSF